MKVLLTFLTIALSINAFSQSVIDTIITDDFDTIPCQITRVSHYSIYYKYPRNNRLKEEIIPRLLVEKFVINNSGVTVQDQKFDSRINLCYKQSKLDRKYDELLLKDNSSSDLIILADSIFVFNKIDYFQMAVNIQLFARDYKCKLIHILDVKQESPYLVHVRLYDSPDEYYQQVLESYKQSKYCFFRGNDVMEITTNNLRFNDSIVWLAKNKFVEFNVSDLDTAYLAKYKLCKDSIYLNQYCFVGNANNYMITPELFFVAAGGVLGLGIYFVLIDDFIGSRFNNSSNFCGEFIKLVSK